MSIDTQIQALLREMVNSPSDTTLSSLFRCAQRAGKVLVVIRADTFSGPIVRRVWKVTENKPSNFQRVIGMRDPAEDALYYYLSPTSNCWTLEELLYRQYTFDVIDKPDE